VNSNINEPLVVISQTPSNSRQPIKKNTKMVGKKKVQDGNGPHNYIS